MVIVKVKGANGREFGPMDLFTTDKFADIISKITNNYNVTDIQSLSLDGGSIMDRTSTSNAVQTWPSMKDNDDLILISPGQDGISVNVRASNGVQIGSIDILPHYRFSDILSYISQLPGAPNDIVSLSLEGGSIMDASSTTTAQQTWPTMAVNDNLAIIGRGSDGTF